MRMCAPKRTDRAPLAWVTFFFAALIGAIEPVAAQSGSFIAFESGPVRPLALVPQPTGSALLLAVNTPDARLEVFTIQSDGSLVHAHSVPVGLEPVAVAARTASEAWVVNHLSDSVSIVDLALTPPRVVRTLLVGDEPRDIVFAGATGNRAFITTARRGQHLLHADLTGVQGAGPPQLATPSEGRAHVWVFDATSLGSAFGGTPVAIVELFGDTPRGLAKNASGSVVYAAIFHSGNQTTTITEGAVCNTSDATILAGTVEGPCTGPGGDTFPGGLPLPHKNVAGDKRPETGLIVKFDPSTGQWRDEIARNWSSAVRFKLPDHDVFAIDTASLTASVLADHVGTTLFNLAVHTDTASGKDTVYVSNTESPNHVRFEGPGEFVQANNFKPAGVPATVQGHLAEARITRIAGGLVGPVQLNGHLDYGKLVTNSTFDPTAKNHSLATPLDMVLTSNGARLFVAAFGSGKVGAFSTAALVPGFDPSLPAGSPASASYIDVAGGGPAGLALDEPNKRLYVFTRFDNTVSVVDLVPNLSTGNERPSRYPLYNPEPVPVRNGRVLLYDASYTSANGEASCASCHVFGDMDHLAWDLGDPDGLSFLIKNPNVPFIGVTPNQSFHPMKGPMTTQSLRGLPDHGPLHWRGDRSHANATDNPNDAFDEREDFKRFNPAFQRLVGRGAMLPDSEMTAFADFVLAIPYPPNPNRAFTNDDPSPVNSSAEDLYNVVKMDANVVTCNQCHVLDPSQGFFGSSGHMANDAESQLFKVAHLRNLYQKVGMFGLPQIDFLRPGNNQSQGDQVRGFGFLHDGSIDTLDRFLDAAVFVDKGDADRNVLEKFLLGFPSNLAPIVGQQITVNATNVAVAGPRVDLMRSRALKGECDLIARAVAAGAAHGWLYDPSQDAFQPDTAAAQPVSLADLEALPMAAAGQAVTFTAAPPGSGIRMALDRDEDGFFDTNEVNSGSDPADPASIPTDLVPPVLSCPPNTVVFGANASDGLHLKAPGAVSPQWTAFLEHIATDNIDPAPVVTASGPGLIAIGGSANVTINAADASGNVATPCIVSIKVVAPAAIVLVLDDTGSMTSGAAASDPLSKIQALREAVEVFTDVLAEHRPYVPDKIGVVSFKVPTSGVSDFLVACKPEWAQDLLAVDAATPAQLVKANEVVQAPPTGSMAADGIATPLRSGVEHGAALLSTQPNWHRRLLLLLTDGLENTPNCKIAPNVVAFRNTVLLGPSPDINLLAVGFGAPSDVDGVLLTQLADGGGYYDTATTAVELQKWLATPLSVALEQTIVVDPSGIIAPSASHSLSVDVTSHERTLTVLLNWARPASDLHLTLSTPNGTVIAGDDPSNGVRLLAGDTYRAFVLRLPHGGGAHAGTWKVTIDAPSTTAPAGEPWSLVVFADSDIKLSTEPPAAEAISAGAIVRIRARMERKLVREAQVRVRMEEPAEPWGTSLAGLGLTDPQVEALQLRNRLDVDAPAQRVALFRERNPFRDVPPPRIVPLHDDGRHNDRRAGDGLFGASVELSRDGAYRLTFEVEGVTTDGEPFRREFRRALWAPVRVDAKASEITVERPSKDRDWWTSLLPNPPAPDPARQVRYVRITPRGSSGLLLGPGQADRIEATLDMYRVSQKRLRRRLPVHDVGDGSYLVEVVIEERTRAARVHLRAAGTPLPIVPLVKAPWRLFWMR